jgi:hypothetical protein
MNTFPFEKFAIPVLSYNIKEKLEVIATATPVKVDDDNLFLINASHAFFDDVGNPRTLYISPPYEQVIKLPLAIHNKSIYIAATPIDLNFIHLFRHLEFLSLTTNDFKKFNDIEKRVTFFGFPASRSSVDYKRKEVKTKPMAHTGEEIKKVSNKVSGMHSIDLNIHILSRFRRNNIINQNMDNNITISPKTKGLSGGPAFRFYIEVGNETRYDRVKAFDFVGIGIEVLANPSLLKAVKKSVILDFIKTTFPMKFRLF